MRTPCVRPLGRILTLFLADCLPLTLFARIIAVPDDYQTIQAALEASEDGDTVFGLTGDLCRPSGFRRLGCRPCQFVFDYLIPGLP